MFTVRGLKMPWARVTCPWRSSYPTDGASPYAGPIGRQTLVRRTFLFVDGALRGSSVTVG